MNKKGLSFTTIIFIVLGLILFNIIGIGVIMSKLSSSPILLVIVLIGIVVLLRSLGGKKQ